jgi:hypothetical protein
MSNATELKPAFTASDFRGAAKFRAAFVETGTTGTFPATCERADAADELYRF